MLEELFCPHFWGQVVLPQLAALWPLLCLSGGQVGARLRTLVQSVRQSMRRSPMNRRVRLRNTARTLIVAGVAFVATVSFQAACCATALGLIHL